VFLIHLTVKLQLRIKVSKLQAHMK